MRSLVDCGNDYVHRLYCLGHVQWTYKMKHFRYLAKQNTWLFEIIVRVLTTCHTQYT
jgi:hypothetical protein